MLLVQFAGGDRGSSNQNGANALRSPILSKGGAPNAGFERAAPARAESADAAGLAQRGLGVKQAALAGGNGDADLNLYHETDGRAQTANGFAKNGLALALHQALFRIGGRGFHVPTRFGGVWMQRGVHGNFASGTALAQEHQRGVDGDAREPSGEAGTAIEILDMQKSAQVGILQGILCVFMILGDAARGKKHFVRATAKEDFESFGLAALGGGNQFMLGQRGEAGAGMKSGIE